MSSQAVASPFPSDLEAILDRLGPRQRRMLVLSYFHGHTQAQISAELGVPDTTVRSTIANAMQQFAGLLLSDRHVTR